jgi:integrase
MPHQLNKTFVESTSEPGEYTDDKLAGFRLKITESGSKVYLVCGTVPGKRQPVRVTIGHHGDRCEDGTVLTANKAREEAERIRGKLKSGINPNDERREREEAQAKKRAEKERVKELKTITVRRAFDEYLAEPRQSKTRTRKNKKLKESTAYIYRCVVNSRLKDWLDKPLSELTPDMVKKRHKDISTKFLRDANHAMSILRAVCYFAADHYIDGRGEPYITSTSVERLFKGMVENQIEPRKTLIKDDQFYAWFQAVECTEPSRLRDYFTITLLTGLRKTESASLLWRNIDFSNRSLKAIDTKNGQDLVLPLSNHLRGIFKQLWNEGERGEFVFPGETRSGHMSTNIEYQFDKVVDRAKSVLAQSDDDKTRHDASNFFITIHSLRRTFTSVAGRLAPDYIVKRLTNHKNASDVTFTNYLAPDGDPEPLREHMQKIEDFILSKARVNLVSMEEVRPAKRRKSKT